MNNILVENKLGWVCWVNIWQTSILDETALRRLLVSKNKGKRDNVKILLHKTLFLPGHWLERISKSLKKTQVWIFGDRRNIHESYDLKGSVRNRLVAAGEKTDDRSAMQVRNVLLWIVASHIFTAKIEGYDLKHFERFFGVNIY